MKLQTILYNQTHTLLKVILDQLDILAAHEVNCKQFKETLAYQNVKNLTNMFSEFEEAYYYPAMTKEFMFKVLESIGQLLSQVVHRRPSELKTNAVNTILDISKAILMVF